MIRHIPKAELHCHIEGAAAPDLALSQADAYKVDVSAHIDREKGYLWKDFSSFLETYDLVASLFRTPEDYALLAETHYLGLARQNCLYAEIFVSPGHAGRIGCSYRTLIAAIAEGMDNALAKTGIEGRMIVTGIRHEGAEAVEDAARLAAKHPHRLVTGFGMAGDERVGHVSQFARAFDIAREGGLQTTCHAGEFGGAGSVEATLEHIGPSRIGHGVRAIENPAAVERLAETGTVLEVCPVSNLVLGVFPSARAHPLRQLQEAGCQVTLNSDDPPHFHTTLENEYRVAAESFGYDEDALLDLTCTAINAAFVDGDTRKRLLEKCVPGAIE